MARLRPFTLAVAVAFAVVLAGATATADAAAARASRASNDALATTQLPRGIRPLHYDVALVPNAATLTFDGRATVTIDVAAPTSRITLNAVGLAFSSVRLLPAAGRSTGVAAAAIDVDAAAQTATFSFARPIPAGRHRLAMTYAGTIGTQANGLFAIDYDTPRGRERALFTQFENSDARRVHPVLGRAGVQGDLRRSRRPCRRRRWRSATCRSPSTGPRHGGLRPRPLRAPRRRCRPTCCSSASATSSARPRVDGRPRSASSTQRGAIDQARFALEASQRILREYNDYFGMPYPLPKLDNVASPGSSQFFARWRTGARSSPSSTSLLRRSDDLDPGRPAARLRDRRARDRAPVVRRPRHHALVGRPLAQRRLRHLDGVAHDAKLASRVAASWAVGARRRDEAMARDAFATTHSDRAARRDRRAGEPGLRRDHLLEGRRRSSRMLEDYVGDDAWRAGVRALHEGARLRQHRHRRPLARGRAPRPPSRSSTSPTTSRCSPASR